jgi:hypothetical protein
MIFELVFSSTNFVAVKGVLLSKTMEAMQKEEIVF